MQEDAKRARDTGARRKQVGEQMLQLQRAKEDLQVELQGIEAVSESDDTSLADSLETITTQNAKLKAEAAAQRAAEEERSARQHALAMSLLQVCMQMPR
jgi:hypothetical protein